MAKKLAVLMTIVCIGLAAFVVNMKLAEDNESPEITFSNDSLTYKSSMSDAELLEDVRAIDNKDGDVSASLTIEDIYSVSDEDIVVVYVAKDNSNNISKAKRLLKGEELQEEEVSSELAENLISEDGLEASENGLEASEDSAVEAVSGNVGLDDTTVTPTPFEGVPVEDKTEADVAREEQEALADNMPAGCPKIYLTDYWIEVPVGTTIDAVSYVKDIIDESENFYELSKKIQIYDSNGNQPGVNISFPAAGTYEYTFFVVDNQSNASNSPKLKVVAN